MTRIECCCGRLIKLVPPAKSTRVVIRRECIHVKKTTTTVVADQLEEFMFGSLTSPSHVKATRSRR